VKRKYAGKITQLQQECVNKRSVHGQTQIRPGYQDSALLNEVTSQLVAALIPAPLRRRSNFSDYATNTLRDWFSKHKGNPYPTDRWETETSLFPSIRAKGEYLTVTQPMCAVHCALRLVKKLES
jgi:hypothetical protein